MLALYPDLSQLDEYGYEWMLVETELSIKVETNKSVEYAVPRGVSPSVCTCLWLTTIISVICTILCHRHVMFTYNNASNIQLSSLSCALNINSQQALVTKLYPARVHVPLVLLSMLAVIMYSND